MQDLVIRKSDTAMMLDKELNYEIDGDILFAAPPRIAAIGAIRQRSKTEMVADASMNGGKDGVVIHPTYGVVYVTGDELDVLGAALDAVRSGALKKMARMTAAQLETIEEEWIGDEVSRQPFNY